MPIVDIRWRPSGGRGEYEHVPVEVLLHRNISVVPLVIGGALIRTDVWGRIRDGKPRLRRDSPNDRSTLNLPQLIAALALLPDPIRQDKGVASFPLRHKNYVISSLSFDADIDVAGIALCTPLRMKVLHDGGEIDLYSRLGRVGQLLQGDRVPVGCRPVARSFLSLIRQGTSSSVLRDHANNLLEWIDSDLEASSFLDAPSEVFFGASAETEVSAIELQELSADETKRKLRSHYRLERSRKIRNAKVQDFRDKYGAVYCENCSFDFSKKYGCRGEGFIEVHHVVPLAALLPNTVTFLSDLLLLCSNCHRMVHRRRPDLSPIQLKQITALSSL